MISPQASPRDDRPPVPDDVAALCAASPGFARAVAEYMALSRAARPAAPPGYARG